MGKLYGVGVGPGDPTLITIKARDIIAAADIICVPKAKNDSESIALKIVSPYLAGQEILEVTMPMTKDKEKLQQSWEQAAQKVAKFLTEGKTVVFPTLGDVTIYSTFGYLADEVKKKLPEVEIEMIPGITSFSAAAAKLNMRLVEGSEPLVIIPDGEENAIEEIIPKFSSVVLMKISGYWERLKDTLSNSNRESIMISRIGQAGETVNRDISTLNEKPDYLSLAIVKKSRGER